MSRGRIRCAALIASLAAIFAAGRAPAHESDYSYLRLTLAGQRIEGEWEIHLRDARILLGLAPDLAGETGWAELREKAPALSELFSQHLRLASGEQACPLTVGDGFVQQRERPYALLRFEAHCPTPIRTLRLRYDLLFDLDPKHRGFFAVDDPYQTYIGVFTASEVDVSFDVRQLDRWRQFVDYLREGLQHIWLGIDHVLFLIALLLPAPLVAVAGGLWLPRETFRAVGVEVLKVVTAFTVAHSITLSLAVLGALRLPGRWVEAAIAFSVFAAAWNNLRPFLPGRPWVLAFGFGLVHGLGFAGALSQLGLPRQAKGLALLAFNLGVEIGQLAIVALILPAMFAARRTPAYQQIVLRLGSLLIAWIAAVWLIERLLGFELIPLP